MALSEDQRKKLLGDMGLASEGASLSLAPEPEQAATPEPAIQTDVQGLSDEQLLAPGAFDIHKKRASEVGRATSSPHNRALYAAINAAKQRQREAERVTKRKAKHERRAEKRTHVKGQVQQATVERTTESVLQVLREAGIDLDALSATLQERDSHAPAGKG